jgi:S1-C subfamily serine protease
MTSSTHPLAALSERTGDLVAGAARGIVSVGAGRWSASGIHWRPGVIVTAEDALSQDENIVVTLPGGKQVAASLAGRDPSTDVAVLRIDASDLPVAETGDPAKARAGQIVLAVGSRLGAPVASLGIVAFAGGAWSSMRGGTIDALLRLDLNLSPRGVGGALIDTDGRVLGMTVFGPRRRPLAIPSTTIDRAVDQLLAKGHAVHGYFGAGLQRVHLGRPGAAEGGAGTRGILIASLDPSGPAAKAGLLLGDIVTTWDAKPVGRLREVMRLLGPDSVGRTVDLGLLRGGAPATARIVIGERPLA